jgi:hypothetical protein
MGLFAKLFGLEEMWSGSDHSRKVATARSSGKVIIEGGCNSGFDMSLEFPDFSEVGAFLTQRPLPYLWPEHRAYRKSIDEHDNPQDVLQDQWTVAFLSHPNPEIVLATLKRLDLRGRASVVIICLALLLAYGEDAVAREAARVVWTGNDWIIEQMLGMLWSRDTSPSGIEPDRGKRGTELIRQLCPHSRTALFRKLTGVAFAPDLDGVAVGTLESPNHSSASNHGESAKAIENYVDSISDENHSEIVGVFSQQHQTLMSNNQELEKEMARHWQYTCAENNSEEVDAPVTPNIPLISDDLEIGVEELVREGNVKEEVDQAIPDPSSEPHQQVASNDEDAASEAASIDGSISEQTRPITDDVAGAPVKSVISMDGEDNNRQIFQGEGMRNENVKSYESSVYSQSGREHYFVNESSRSEEIGRAFQRL